MRTQLPKHTKNIAISLILALMLAGCQSAAVVSENATHPEMVSSADSVQPSCPSLDFNVFIKAFANDANTQKSFTANPLMLEYLDSTDAGFEVKKENINPSLQNKAYFLSTYQSGKWSLDTKISKLSQSQYHVTTNADNAVLHYDFMMQKNCWYLTRYQNMSL